MASLIKEFEASSITYPMIQAIDAGGPPVIFPGEETNVVFNFIFLALLTWSCFAAELYYALLHTGARQKRR
ncbi:hypothetical protein DF164_32235 [Burkholderia stagnalis]|nr:hypothetical protein DF164_32235 [Burkholderia stagnalis]RQY32749.1 hypothetical protein DF113_31095 [Burkholderia stagnalis]RQY64604.1 hypothetical protein DF110_31875 [Burkholderia stagnalis]